MVIRDIFYDGNPIYEKSSIVLRIAPTFIRYQELSNFVCILYTFFINQASDISWLFFLFIVSVQIQGIPVIYISQDTVD